MFIGSGFRFGFHLEVHDPKLVSAGKNNVYISLLRIIKIKLMRLYRRN